jgi:hypothetical protein
MILWNGISGTKDGNEITLKRKQIGKKLMREISLSQTPNKFVVAFHSQVLMNQTTSHFLFCFIFGLLSHSKLKEQTVSVQFIEVKTHHIHFIPGSELVSCDTLKAFASR